MTQVLEEKKVETKAWPWLTFGLGCAVAAAACVWIPIHVIRPFHPQEARALATALWVHDAGPLLAALRAAFVRDGAATALADSRYDATPHRTLAVVKQVRTFMETKVRKNHC